MATTPSNKIIIQAHPDKPDLFRLTIHLRVEFSTGKQFDTEWVTMPELEILLRRWCADRTRFIWEEFGWDAAMIDRHIRSHGNAGRGSKAAPLAHITLADLGL